jgi:RNA polymerase sporulation-specific sigma factor
MSKQDNDTFIENNLGLVHALANRFRGRGIEYEELYSAGCIGLVKAAKGFDESRGLRFSTYAVPVILGEIKRLFRDGGSVKVSRTLKELSLKVCRLQEQMAKEGKEAHLSELAEELGISLTEAGEALSVSRPPISLTGMDEDGSETDVPMEAPQIKATERIALQQSLSSLSSTDRQLILLRYWEEKTQKEAGDILGMTQVQVSRREKKILDELRKLMV